VRVFFTGGSGNAGRRAPPILREHGHAVVNFDRVPLGLPGVPDVAGDVTDPGMVAEALALGRFDALVHFAAIPKPLAVPDAEMFRVNRVGTEVVLQAAARAGVGKMILASSESIYGMCYADGTMQPERLPLDEETAVTPMDSYGLSKVANEATARMVQALSGADVLCLRMARVYAPEDYPRHFPEDFANPAPRRRGSFAYVDGRDLGEVLHLALMARGLGFQILNVAQSESALPFPTGDLARRFFPGVPVTREFGRNESLVCTRKLRALLGHVDRHSWRDHVAVS
jgi:nucleoside-diphosphate-sugar epimerase